MKAIPSLKAGASKPTSSVDGCSGNHPGAARHPSKGGELVGLGKGGGWGIPFPWRGGRRRRTGWCEWFGCDEAGKPPFFLTNFAVPVLEFRAGWMCLFLQMDDYRAFFMLFLMFFGYLIIFLDFFTMADRLSQSLDRRERVICWAS
jgi:hypothetical protein